MATPGTPLPHQSHKKNCPQNKDTSSTSDAQLRQEAASLAQQAPSQKAEQSVCPARRAPRPPSSLTAGTSEPGRGRDQAPPAPARAHCQGHQARRTHGGYPSRSRSLDPPPHAARSPVRPPAQAPEPARRLPPRLPLPRGCCCCARSPWASCSWWVRGRARGERGSRAGGCWAGRSVGLPGLPPPPTVAALLPRGLEGQRRGRGAAQQASLAWRTVGQVPGARRGLRVAGPAGPRRALCCAGGRGRECAYFTRPRLPSSWLTPPANERPRGQRAAAAAGPAQPALLRFAPLLNCTHRRERPARPG